MTVIYRLVIDVKLVSPKRSDHSDRRKEKIHMCKNTQTDTLIQIHHNGDDKENRHKLKSKKRQTALNENLLKLT